MFAPGSIDTAPVHGVYGHNNHNLLRRRRRRLSGYRVEFDILPAPYVGGKQGYNISPAPFQLHNDDDAVWAMIPRLWFICSAPVWHPEWQGVEPSFVRPITGLTFGNKESEFFFARAASSVLHSNFGSFVIFIN